MVKSRQRLLRMRVLERVEYPGRAVELRVRRAECRPPFYRAGTFGLRDKPRTILVRREWLVSDSACARRPGYTTIEALDAVLPATLYQREPLPWEAGFLAGKSFLHYRHLGGARTSPLPDFYIGAHAAIRHLALLTRDAARYRSYFPKVEILAPTKRGM